MSTTLTSIQILKDLEDRDLLRQLVKDGHVSPTVVARMQMYYQVDALVKCGDKRGHAVKMVAAMFSVTPRCVNINLKMLV